MPMSILASRWFSQGKTKETKNNKLIVSYLWHGGQDLLLDIVDPLLLGELETLLQPDVGHPHLDEDGVGLDLGARHGAGLSLHSSNPSKLQSFSHFTAHTHH